MVVAREMGTGYGTSPLKILVDQYAETLLKNEAFKNLARTLKGRNAYDCVYRRVDMGGGKIDFYGRVASPKADEAPCLRPPVEMYLIEKVDGKEVFSAISGDIAKIPIDELGKRGEIVAKQWSCPYLGDESYTYRAMLNQVPQDKKQRWIDTHAVGCPYYNAKNEGQLHRFVVTTLHYLFYAIASRVSDQAVLTKIVNPETNERNVGDFSHLYPPPTDHLNAFEKGSGWQLRNTLVIDEAHNIDDQLVNFFSLSITDRTFKAVEFGDQKVAFPYEKFRKEIGMVDTKDINELSEKTILILKSYFKLYNTKVKELDKLANSVRNEETDEVEKKAMTEAINKISKVIYNNMITEKKMNAPSTSWIFQMDDEILSWKPYNAAAFTRRFFNSFEHILLSSATFLDIPQLLRNSGIPQDYGIVTVNPTFDPAKAPIIIDSVGRIGNKNMTLMIPKIIDSIANIARKHKNERGFVHCANYPLQQEIINKAPDDLKKRLVWHDRNNREDAFQDWVENGKSDSIFLSVYMGEGTDLAGDTATWQVIAKIPYLYLGDAWVQAHAKFTPGQKWVDPAGRKWYDSKAMISVIQMCGRIVRSVDDMGVTYILDGNFKGLMSRFKDQLQPWFLARIVASA